MWESRDDPQAAIIRVDAGCGWLPSGWLPHEAIRAGLRACGRGAGLALGYGSPQGMPALREQFAMQLRARGLEIDGDRILTTQGASQALDLIVRELLDPGDVVAVEDPTYPPLLGMLRARPVEILSVARTDHGPDPEQFATHLARRRVRALFTNTTLQNPTGTSTSFPVAHRLLELAEKHDVLIIEDDIFAELALRQQASLAVLDQVSACSARQQRVENDRPRLASWIRCRPCGACAPTRAGQGTGGARLERGNGGLGVAHPHARTLPSASGDRASPPGRGAVGRATGT